MDDSRQAALPEAVFLSDVHLASPADDNYRRMLALLRSLEGVPQLFILGDFFDFWMEFTAVVPARYVKVLAALEALKDSGTRLYFIEGNHDFSMGAYITDTLGAELHPAEMEATVGGRKLYLAHGDLTDQNDRGYQRLRRVLRSRIVAWGARTLAPKAALWVARFLEKNASAGMVGGERLPDLMREAARAKWREGYDGVMMGHCHMPEFTEESFDNRTCFYTNLGDWISHYTYVVFAEGRFEMRTAPPLNEPV